MGGPQPDCNDLSQVACSSQGSQRQIAWVGPTYLQDPYGVSDLGCTSNRARA